MIRIDEIYNNTFWPYIQKNMPKTRMFLCDPPGRSDIESLHNFGKDNADNNYIFFETITGKDKYVQKNHIFPILPYLITFITFLFAFVLFFNIIVLV